MVITACHEDLDCQYGPHRTLLLPSALAVTALGTTLLIVGVGNKLRYKRWEKWTPGDAAVLSPTFSRQGAGFAYAARF